MSNITLKDQIVKFMNLNNITVSSLGDSEVVQDILDKATLNGTGRDKRNQISDICAALYRDDLKKKRTDVGAYKPSNIAPVSSLYADPDTNLDMAVTYFIYQVKRKALGLPVNEKVFVIFQSKNQGTMKSSLVKHILGIDPRSREEIVPRGYVGSISLSLFTDHRYEGDHARRLVLFFDEMAGADKTCREKMKSSVMADDTDVTSHYSNGLRNAKINYTLIATSHYKVETLIPDPTGQRRYWEIVVDSKPSDLDAWDAYDWKALWLSVNPNEPHPAEKFIAAREHESKVSNPMDLWLEDVDQTISYGANEFHKSYLDFCKNNKVNSKDTLTMKQFKLALEAKGLKSKRSNKGVTWNFSTQSTPEPTITIEATNA